MWQLSLAMPFAQIIAKQSKAEQCKTKQCKAKQSRKRRNAWQLSPLIPCLQQWENPLIGVAPGSYIESKRKRAFRRALGQSDRLPMRGAVQPGVVERWVGVAEMKNSAQMNPKSTNVSQIG